MSDGADGFLARWSRRKSGLAEPVDAEMKHPSLPAVVPVPVAAIAEAEAEAEPEPVALPTLADVAALTRDSDYSRFVVTGVDPGVRNAAMKKLFSDPHFNVMDGLDTYIDDYGKPDPIPLSMLRHMNQSAVLGLFADEVADAAASPDGATTIAMAQSAPEPVPLEVVSEPESEPEPEPATDDDPDLRLQPDDADRRAGPEPGPRA